ncbi:hypothetical protein CGLO_08754 [Colletotrichum gloeosporioides Cg-14]|uniref:Uncharacterized protein n=1 Tax=Colletotrichum gloeosporioides (strain Cg-14) TaxID=1237896 RepID=T0LTU6_COLGC|nr:hypothetical protein CGLO_08754 [Colletotrichum gloeosporioides Cg-14]
MVSTVGASMTVDGERKDVADEEETNVKVEAGGRTTD